MLGPGTGVSDVRGAETDPVSAMACSRVAASISMKGPRQILPARSCRRYINNPWALRGQTHKAASQASMNAW